jgi:hypothetical protein
MKRIALSVAVVMLCVVIAGVVFAVPQSQRISTKTMLADRNNDGKIDGVDVYDQNDKVMQRGYDSNNDMVIDRWEQTDENTGLPIVTPSDGAFELNPSD